MGKKGNTGDIKNPMHSQYECIGLLKQNVNLSELSLTKTRHLFQAHLNAQLGHRLINHQAAHALFQLAHIGLLFFSDRTAERQV